MASPNVRWKGPLTTMRNCVRPSLPSPIRFPKGRQASCLSESDAGTILGVSSPDSLQKKIRDVAEQDCYPPFRYQTRVFECERKAVLAVLVTASKERPHFSGHAYVRVGSESKKASPKVYEELIASRNTKTGKILGSKDQRITLRCTTRDRWNRPGILWDRECCVEECDAHSVDLLDVGSGRHYSIPLELITISQDQRMRRMLLEALEGLWMSGG